MKAPTPIGELVLLAKVIGSKNFVLHVACGDRQHGSGAWTYKEWLSDHGVAYLRASGFLSLSRDPRGALRGAWTLLQDGTYVPRIDIEEFDGHSNPGCD